jgi:hypothetical protein
MIRFAMTDSASHFPDPPGHPLPAVSLARFHLLQKAKRIHSAVMSDSQSMADPFKSFIASVIPKIPSV